MNHAHSPRPPRSNRKRAGFTLIELMITVAIVGILVKIALPAYMNYVMRADIQRGLQALSADRVKMEQYFMDNRSYSGDTGGAYCGSGVIGQGKTIDTATEGKFTISCTPTKSASSTIYDQYTITATGSGSLANFVYTVNQINTMTSAITKTGWPASCSNSWVSRPGSC